MPDLKEMSDEELLNEYDSLAAGYTGRASQEIQYDTVREEILARMARGKEKA